MEVIDLVSKNEHASMRMDDTYHHIKKDLTQIVEDKESLKVKVNEEVKETSEFLKEMAFKRTKSQERVIKEEVKKNGLSEEQQVLECKVKRIKQVENQRIL